MKFLPSFTSKNAHLLSKAADIDEEYLVKTIGLVTEDLGICIIDLSFVLERKNLSEATRKLLLDLVDHEEDRLCLLGRAIQANYYRNFTAVSALLSRDVINRYLKNDHYRIIMSCFTLGLSFAMGRGGARVLEEIFEKYLTNEDLRDLANRLMHEHYQYLCMYSSKKVVAQLFSLLTRMKKIALIKQSNFYLINVSACNKENDDMALFLLEQLEGHISTSERSQLISIVLGVSAKNDLLSTVNKVLTTGDDYKDEKVDLSRTMNLIAKDNYRLFMAASARIRQLMIDKFIPSERVKKLLLIAEVRWLVYMEFICRFEYFLFRQELLNLLVENISDEKDIVSLGESKDSMIKEICTMNHIPYLSEKERRFISQLKAEKSRRDYPKLYQFLSTIVMIDPYRWSEKPANYMMKKFAAKRHSIETYITPDIDIVALQRVRDYFNSYLDKCFGMDRQHLTIILPQLNMIEMERDIFDLFRPVLSRQISLPREQVLWVESLDVILGAKTRGKDVYINGDVIHHQLLRSLGAPPKECLNHHLSVAQLGFVTSMQKTFSGEAKLPACGRNHVSFPVAAPNNVIYAMNPSTEPLNQTLFYRHLDRDIKTVNNTLRANERLDEKNFALAYGHSEQALFEFLESAAGIKYILQQLTTVKVTTGYKVYAVILDICSNMQICEHCKWRALAVQNSQKEGFLAILGDELKKSGIRIPKHGLNMLVRVSAVSPFVKAKPYPAIRGKTPDYDRDVSLLVVPPKPLAELQHEATDRKLHELPSMLRYDNGHLIVPHIATPDKTTSIAEYKSLSLPQHLTLKQLQGRYLLELPVKIVDVFHKQQFVTPSKAIHTFFASGSKKKSYATRPIAADASAAKRQKKEDGSYSANTNTK